MRILRRLQDRAGLSLRQARIHFGCSDGGQHTALLRSTRSGQQRRRPECAADARRAALPLKLRVCWSLCCFGCKVAMMTRSGRALRTGSTGCTRWRSLMMLADHYAVCGCQ